MSQWWTYSPADLLIFSARTYYRLFELYNAAFWPAHVLAIAVGLGVLVAWRHKRESRGRIIAAILAVCWLWVGWAYFWENYSTISWFGPYLAAAFAFQAALLIWTGIVLNRLNLQVTRIGVGLFLFALALQPWIGLLFGRDWRQTEIFALAPDPTAVATVGVLLATTRIHWHLIAIPLLWCAFTGQTLWAMGVPDALVTPVAGAVALFFAAWRAVARNNDRGE